MCVWGCQFLYRSPFWTSQIVYCREFVLFFLFDDIKKGGLDNDGPLYFFHLSHSMGMCWMLWNLTSQSEDNCEWILWFVFFCIMGVAGCSFYVISIRCLDMCNHPICISMWYIFLRHLGSDEFSYIGRAVEVCIVEGGILRKNLLGCIVLFVLYYWMLFYRPINLNVLGMRGWWSFRLDGLWRFGKICLMVLLFFL